MGRDKDKDYIAIGCLREEPEWLQIREDDDSIVSVFPGILCDQYYQLTDRWGLVQSPPVQSAAPVSALLSELQTHVTGDHPDMMRKWLYPDTNTAYLGPATSDISFPSPSFLYLFVCTSSEMFPPLKLLIKINPTQEK